MTERVNKKVEPSKQRASIFEDIDVLDVDVSAFGVKRTTDDRAPPREHVKAVAEAVNFRSREPSAATSLPAKKRAGRVYRTGRNVQFNIKASQETVEVFYEITEAHSGW